MGDSGNGTGPRRRPRRRTPSKRSIRTASAIAKATGIRPVKTEHVKLGRASGKQSILHDAGRIAVLLEALRQGAPMRLACEYAGIAVPTVEEWMRRAVGADDRPPRPEHIVFAEAVTRARAEAHMYALKQVRVHMPRDFQAAKFWLTTQHPEVWGSATPTPAAVSPVDQGVITQQNNIVVIAPDQLEALGLAALATKQLTPEASDGDGSRALDDLIVAGDDADLSTA